MQPESSNRKGFQPLELESSVLSKRLPVVRLAAAISVHTTTVCVRSGIDSLRDRFSQKALEVRTNEDPSLWPNVEDPAIQHPFSNRILQMKEVYKHLYQVTGEEQPLLKLAAYVKICPPEKKAH
jgi:hypothetical protein